MRDLYADVTAKIIAALEAGTPPAACSLEGHLQHPAYIANWLQVLKADNRAVFTAAAKAQQAADYVQGMAKPAPRSPAEVAEAA